MNNKHFSFSHWVFFEKNKTENKLLVKNCCVLKRSQGLGAKNEGSC